jgi:hypothetical protein
MVGLRIFTQGPRIFPAIVRIDLAKAANACKESNDGRVFVWYGLFDRAPQGPPPPPNLGW